METNKTLLTYCPRKRYLLLFSIIFIYVFSSLFNEEIAQVELDVNSTNLNSKSKNNNSLVYLDCPELRININNNQNISCSWDSIDIFINYNSYIGLFLFATDNSNKLKSVKLNSKSINFEVSEAGIYQLRYFPDENGISLASSKAIIVTNSNIVLIFQEYNLQKLKIKWELKINNIFSPDKEIFLCLNLLGYYDKCLWVMDIKTEVGEIIIDKPKFIGYFLIRMIEKYNKDTKMKTIAVSDYIRLSDKNIDIETGSNVIMGSSVNFVWRVQTLESNDWAGLYSLHDSNSILKSSTPLILKSIKSTQGKLKLSLPMNSGATDLVFIYFRNSKPVAISNIIHIHQPYVECGAKSNSNIKNLVIISTEGHSFDSYFGNYCEGDPSLRFSCNNGRQCCEKAPKAVSGRTPYVLNDNFNLAWHPKNNQECQLCEINNGEMDKYIEGCNCSDERNFAYADLDSINVLRDLAGLNSLADNYFQPSPGTKTQNDMYFSRASYVFKDDSVLPLGSYGGGCRYFSQDLNKFKIFYDPSIISVMNKCTVVIKSYIENYDFSKVYFKDNKCYPDGFDGSDVPFSYFIGVTNNDNYMSDIKNLEYDIKAKTLPDISFIKPLGKKRANPSFSKISNEQKFIKETVDMILNSDYYESTLILWVADESGGFFDHISPPKKENSDGVPYGPRVPFMAIGKFAKKNYVSHDEMEHSSIVKFIEWNWLKGETGQLGTRDTEVNNILDMLDLDQ